MLSKQAIIFHGTGCSPDMYWYPWIAQKLEIKGYKTHVPHMPNSNEANLSEWLPFALEYFSYDDNTILIGHSSGGPLILSILENLEAKIKQAILVGGFLSGYPNILQDKYNWEKINSNCGEFVYINSDNDPWGCDDKEGKKLFDKLGGTQIIMSGQGHFGSTTYNQNYKEFPLLLKLIE